MDMTMMSKIIYGLVNIYFSYPFSYSNSATQSNGVKLFKQSHHSNISFHIFSQRVVTDWNLLPVDIVDAPDVIKFKTLLDRFWSNFHLIALYIAS